jgi:hypothetical protein
MVDHEARKKATALVRQLRDGTITNDDFEDAWPRSQHDRALRAIARTLWASYDSRYTHTLEGRHALNDYGRALFDRRILFLRSDLEYRWPRDRLYAGRGLPCWALVISFGLLLPAVRHLERCYREQEAAGNSRVWPFILSSDHERERDKSAHDTQAFD